MGANIRVVNVHKAAHDDESSRISRNFLKSKDVGSLSFNSCDHATYLVGGEVTPHRHDNVEEIFYFIRGTGVFYLNDEEIPVKAGSAIVVKPGFSHGVRNTGKDVLQHLVCSTVLRKEDPRL